MHDHVQPPLNPLPPVVWVLALPVLATEAVFALGGAGLAGGPAALGWRLEAIQRFAFAPGVLTWMAETGRWPLDHTLRLVTYPFVHTSLMHAVFGLVLLLALGKAVGEVFRWWGVVLVFFGAGVAGALVYWAAGVEAALMGAYPPVYGLIGAFTFLIWVRLAAVGANRLRAFTLIGVLMAIQLVFGVFFGGGFAWIADIAGFAAGFALSFVAVPGGVARVLAILRQR